MNRLNARSAFALLLLLTVLLLPLTCAAAEELTYYYNEYSWDESTGTLKTDVASKKLSEMTQIDLAGSWYLGGTSSDPYFYYVAVPSELDLTYVPADHISVQGNVSVLLLCDVVPAGLETTVNLAEGSTLNIYSLSNQSFSLWDVDFNLGAGSTLNLHCQINRSSFTSVSDSSQPTVNLYQQFHCNPHTDLFPSITNTILNAFDAFWVEKQLSIDNSTLSLYGQSTLRSDSEDNTAVILKNHAKINIGDNNVRFISDNPEGKPFSADETSSISFCPRGEQAYTGIFAGNSSNQTSLIDACKGEYSVDLFNKLNDYRYVTMFKMTAVGIDETPQEYYVDKSPRFQVNVLTEGVSPDSFTVEYKQNGAYSTTPPTQPGTYDVKITRPLEYESDWPYDPVYLPFEKEITDGLTIALRTIEYTSPEPQTLVYDGEPHSLGVTVTSPADATVTYTSGAGEPIGVPAFTDAGDYTVTYTITKTNYETETGSLRLTITPFPIACTATGFTGVYDGEAHGVAIADIRLANAAHAAAVAYTVNGAPYTGVGAPAFTEAGEYAVGYTVSVPGNSSYTPASGSVSVRISPASQAAPTGVAAVAETIRYKNDGRLTGVTAEMEYRAKDSSTYTAVTGTEVAGLAPGTYCVRYKATANRLASGDTQLTVASGRAAYDTDSTQGAKGISADNVLPENEELLRQALNDYQSALDTLGGSFTEAEKQEIQAEMARIRSALETLERTAAVREAIAALPDAVEPDDTGAEADILAAKAAFDALTAHEQALVGDAPAAKLDRLLPMLTAYRIIRGDGASLIAGQNMALGFTANGPLAKLKEVLVDGKTLDAKHYTAQSGSTIITLAADYVKTLAVGEHSLTVRYTDGETSARFTVAAMPQDLPQTGDSSRLTGWLALLGACCAGLWCLNRRRA